MQPSQSPALLQATVAIALGLIIGLEREHHGVEEGRREERLGVRTFAMLALIGWSSLYVGAGSVWLAAAALVTTGAIIAVGSLGAQERDTGLTTETAAIVTVLVGMVVHLSPLVGTALALATTFLLVSKPWLAAVVPKLRRAEITSTLQLLVFAAVVLPLLPNAPVDPWGILVPRKVGWFVLLIAGINYVGYVLVRLLGARRGIRLTGLFGGLASSTAVTLTMSRRGQEHSDGHEEQAAILLAGAVLTPRVLVLAALVNPVVARQLVLPLGGMAACLLVGALWRWRQSSDRDREHGVELGNPFALLPALKWGALFVAILFLAEAARRWFGTRGLLTAASLAGLADVDAITISVARGYQGGATAALAIVLAVATNTLVKTGIAIALGGWRFARAVTLASAVAIGAAAALLAFG
jgi:uncharacterized membrane protein (DUF4010 family)